MLIYRDTLVLLHSISTHHAKSCKMGHDTPPPYTSSAPSPRYSSGLLPGEQTVELTRHASSCRPTGVYRRITDHLTIVLRDQHPGSVYPMYGRSGVIQGDVILSNVADDLTSVILKVKVNLYMSAVGFLINSQLEGHFLLHTSWVPISTTFLSATRVLWGASHEQRCPQTIPFGVIFPRTFDDGGRMRDLPPTFESGKPHATCSYSLTIELVRSRQFLSFSKNREV